MKTKNTNKKKLITKIVTVVCLVATLVAVMVVPSFAYTINNHTGAYASQTYTYSLNRLYPSGYTVRYKECLGSFQEEVIYKWEFERNEIEGFPSTSISLDISNGYGFNNLSLGSFNGLDKTYTYYFNDDRWGDECPYASVKCYYTDDYMGYGDSYLIIELTMHCDEESYSSVTQEYTDYFGDLGTFRIRFAPTLNNYSTVVKDIISNKNNTITDLNNTIIQNNIDFNNMVAQKDKEYNDLKAEMDKDFADMLTEKNNKIADLEDGIAKNGALRSLFNGIGDGISNLIEPFLGLEFNGITVGAIIAFVAVVAVLFVLLKFII